MNSEDDPRELDYEDDITEVLEFDPDDVTDPDGSTTEEEYEEDLVYNSRPRNEPTISESPQSIFTDEFLGATEMEINEIYQRMLVLQELGDRFEEITSPAGMEGILEEISSRIIEFFASAESSNTHSDDIPDEIFQIGDTEPLWNTPLPKTKINDAVIARLFQKADCSQFSTSACVLIRKFIAHRLRNYILRAVPYLRESGRKVLSVEDILLSLNF